MVCAWSNNRDVPSLPRTRADHDDEDNLVDFALKREQLQQQQQEKGAAAAAAGASEGGKRAKRHDKEEGERLPKGHVGN